MSKVRGSSLVRWLLALAVIGGGAWAGVRYWQRPKSAGVEFKTAVVSRGDITQSVTANGSLTPVRMVEVGSQISGVITEIKVDFNSPVKEDDFSIRSQQEISDFANANNRVMTVLIEAFAGISLVVGGIGIMNIMLVSVTERTREIGIRLAVGARARDVLRQFLTEAVLLSVVGGFLGIAAGYWLAPLLTRVAGFPTLISSSSVVLAFFVSAVIGVVFGFFPALKAANLDPIDALRYE